jgi:hypothetical protein
VPAELRAYPSPADTRVAVNAGVLRLERAFGLARPAAAWAVLSLAYAIGRIAEEQFQGLLAELSADSATPSTLDRPSAEPQRPSPRPSLPPLPAPPPPRPASSPNIHPSIYPPGAHPPSPVPQPRAKASLVALAVAGGVLLACVLLYSLTHQAPPPDLKSSTLPDSRQQQPSPPPPPDTKAAAPHPPPASGLSTYSDSSGLFQVMVPDDWVFRRSETDITLDNMSCHLVRAAVFARQAERSDLEGWISEGIRVSIYLPQNGQLWPADWAAGWQKKMIADSLAGYSKSQNTTIEPVQLGNIPATTTAVMGEANVISEAEVARIYVGVSPKFLVAVEVAMPSSKRPAFESADETVRRTFEVKVP